MERYWSKVSTTLQIQISHLAGNSRELGHVKGLVIGRCTGVHVDNHAGAASACEEALEHSGQLAVTEGNQVLLWPDTEPEKNTQNRTLILNVSTTTSSDDQEIYWQISVAGFANSFYAFRLAFENCCFRLPSAHFIVENLPVLLVLTQSCNTATQSVQRSVNVSCFLKPLTTLLILAAFWASQITEWQPRMRSDRIDMRISHVLSHLHFI